MLWCCYWNLKFFKASLSFSCHYVVFGFLVSVSSLISSISPQFILNLTPYLHLPVSPMFILLFFVADQLMCLYCHLMTPCKQFTIKVNAYLSHNVSRRMDTWCYCSLQFWTLGNIDPCNLGLSQHQDLYIGGSSPHDEFWCLNPYWALDPWLEAWDNLEGINNPFIVDNALAWAFLHSTQVRNNKKF